MGVLSDKDYEQMLQILTPMAAKVYTVAPDNARALSSKDLAECVRKYHHDVEERQRLKECLEEVKQQADKEDVIIICGTLSFQNELKQWKDSKRSYGMRNTRRHTRDYNN